MNSDYYGNFTNLLNEDSPLYDESYDVNPTTQHENIVSASASSRQKRSSNFTCEEDISLVSAWLHTSKDAVHGNEQTSTGFWKRIYDEFIINCGQGGRSGRSKSTIFANNDKKSFKFEHCFDILKHEKKWLDTSKKNKQRNTSSINLEGTQISSEDNNSELSANKDRPLGKKLSKESQLKKKQGITEGGSSSRMSLTDERWEAKMVIERERYDQRERLITIQENAIRVDEEHKQIDEEHKQIDEGRKRIEQERVRKLVLSIFH
ncbi:PREDICTED: glutathione S-transferase T3-like [Erythranthe guttata]|uniref:glutathione S-transferase T3-like n=1 Tax=Erythranthe guttata TaxID=4155 RepID=UPI00064E10EE|nr:PREDICTED: glutathione S-transferase T3-like [Erythranthe guttata]|eukprot:XP_012859011.1 PREDICTED: glutathione S-transferase T3-like [Erythranthe guttata]